MSLKIVSTVLIFCFLTNATQGQMRNLDELINDDDPGWVLVKQWIDSARNKVEILPVDNEKAKDALYKTQVTTRAPMGAIVYMTGGLLIDDGWIRILGSGNARLPQPLPNFNRGKTFEEFGKGASHLIIAYDVLGGFFLLNGGGLGEDLGRVYYFAPDNLNYEPLDITYTEFLLFCFNNDLEDFYKGYRWVNWRNEISALNGDSVINFVPSLWTKEGKQINNSSRRAVPVDEQYSLNITFRKQLGIDN
jgi:hypothetical protein